MLKLPIEKIIPIFKKYYSELKIKKINVYYYNISDGQKLIDTVNVLTNADNLKFVTITRTDKINIIPTELTESINNKTLLTNIDISSLDMSGNYDKIVLLYDELSIYDISKLQIFCESVYKNVNSLYLDNLYRDLFIVEPNNVFNEFLENHYEDLKSIIEKKDKISWNAASSLLNEMVEKTKIY